MFSSLTDLADPLAVEVVEHLLPPLPGGRCLDPLLLAHVGPPEGVAPESVHLPHRRRRGAALTFGRKLENLTSLEIV